MQIFFWELLDKEEYKTKDFESEIKYTRQIIVHALINFLRKYGNNSKRKLEAKKLVEYAEGLANREGGDPWEKIGMDPSEWHALVAKATRGTRIDLKDGDLEDIADNEGSSEERMIDKDGLQKILSFLERTRSIKERDRKIFKDYYIHGKTYKKIGEEHEFTESRAKQIVLKVSKTLERKIKESRS